MFLGLDEPQAGAGPLGIPTVRVPQELDEFRAGFTADVQPLHGFRAVCGDPIDAAVTPVPLRVGIGMGGSFVVKIADVDRAIGPLTEVRAQNQVSRLSSSVPPYVALNVEPRRSSRHQAAECCRNSQQR